MFLTQFQRQINFTLKTVFTAIMLHNIKTCINLATVLAITDDTNIVPFQIEILVTIIAFYVNGLVNCIDETNHAIVPVTAVLFTSPLATHPHADT